jgi:hypothetical protein
MGFLAGDLPRESLLDQHPSGGEVRVLCRQGPQRVQVVRQDDHGIDLVVRPKTQDLPLLCRAKRKGPRERP